MVKKIRIAQWAQVNMLYLPLYVAIQKGFFRENGIDAKLILAGNDDEIFRYVSTDEADFGVGDPTFCAMQDSAWQAASVIGTLSQKVSFYGVTLNPLIGAINSVKDLAGLKISVFPRPSTAYSVVKALKQQNKRLLSKTSIIEAPIGRQIKLLKRGECDLVIDIEPFISVYEAEKIRVVADFSRIISNFSFTGIYCKNTTLVGSAEICRAVVRGLNSSLSLINSGNSLEDLLPILRDIFPGIKDPSLKKSFSRIKRSKAWGKNIKTSKEGWNAAIDTRKSIGERFIKEAYSVVVNDI